MIKSLVSPREVVFRFPFQLEVDWAFQRRSAVKSGLYMRKLENAWTTLLSRLTGGLLDWTFDARNKMTTATLVVVYRSHFLNLYLHTETRPTHPPSPADGGNCALPGQFRVITRLIHHYFFTQTKSFFFYQISFTSSSVPRPLLHPRRGRQRKRLPVNGY